MEQFFPDGCGRFRPPGSPDLNPVEHLRDFQSTEAPLGSLKQSKHLEPDPAAHLQTTDPTVIEEEVSEYLL